MGRSDRSPFWNAHARTLYVVAPDKAISQPSRLVLAKQEKRKGRPERKEQVAQEDVEQEDFGDSGGLGHGDAEISEEASDNESIVSDN